MLNPSGVNSIDSLINWSWTNTSGQAVNLTYSFLTQIPPNTAAEDANGFIPMTAAQQIGVRETLAAWSAVANVTFTEVASSGNVQFGTSEQPSTTASLYTTSPSPKTVYVLTNNELTYNQTLKDGAYGIKTLLTEVGFSLGLKLPGDYSGTGIGPFLPAATDDRDHTVMSHNNSTAFALHDQYSSTPMMYDILAMQYLYGANMTYHTGDDIYRFSQISPAECIWDAGGTDTLDFSACTGATVIDLRAGSFSSTLTGYDNISIAYGVTMERAIAGNGGSTIYANDAGDIIVGGTGKDTIYQGAGNDVITGGGGSDTVMYSGTFSSYALSGTGTALTVVGEGTDTLNNIANIEFKDAIVHLSSYILHGGSSGNDVFTDGSGNELFSGGAGIDTLNLAGNASSYTVTKIGTVGQVKDAAGNYDLLSNMERLVFADGAVALDTDGSAGQLYRLYEAMFDRAPDAGGMGYWLNYLDNGGNVNTIASGFVASKEFSTIYGDNATDTAFVTALYNNVLHRAPDQAGLDYWINALHTSVSRAGTLVGFSESAENIVAVAKIIPVDIAFTPWVNT